MHTWVSLPLLADPNSPWQVFFFFMTDHCISSHSDLLMSTEYAEYSLPEQLVEFGWPIVIANFVLSISNNHRIPKLNAPRTNSLLLLSSIVALSPCVGNSSVTKRHPTRHLLVLPCHMSPTTGGYRFKGGTCVLKSSESSVDAGRLKMSTCAEVKRTKNCVVWTRCQILRRRAVGVGKATFGDAVEVGFALARLRGERNSNE